MQDISKLNPDKHSATLISVVPWVINEVKPSIVPAVFYMESGEDTPQSFIIQNICTYVYIDRDRGSMRKDLPPEEVANAVVEDYCSSQIVNATGYARPGLFWVEGFHLPETIQKKFAQKILEARERQTEYFKSLITLANDYWIRAGKQDRAVPDSARIAARMLNLKPEWGQIRSAEQLSKCPACRSAVDNQASICPICRTVINAAEYEKFNTVVAQQKQASK